MSVPETGAVDAPRPPRIGSLCSGYGGLTLAARAVLGGDVAWHSEIEPAADRVLSARFPGIPNIGNMTAVDWSAVEPVDVLEGGTPCQDVSHAGKRAGMRAGTRSGLWSAMVDAIDVLRPRLVVWENVRGVLSAGADSGMEPCALCVGDGTGPVLRALGRVLGDLADLGYDARWCGLRAADVGAPHGRYRIFVLAEDAASVGGRSLRSNGSEPHRTDGSRGAGEFAAAYPRSVRRVPRRTAGPGEAAGGRAFGDVAGRSERSTADSEDHRLASQFASGREPEPARSTGDSARPAADATGERWGEGWPEPAGIEWRSHAAERGAVAADTDRDGLAQLGRKLAGERDADGRDGADTAWGPYEPAIRRWARVTGRPAPAPTEPGRTGQRLSPRFVEWMMGLPAGWVTDVPGITRNDQLKMLGNGVVPQQAEAALRHLLAIDG